MRQTLRTELDQMRRDLLEIGARVEGAVRRALGALRDRKPELARLVVAGDADIDTREIELEEDCLKTLALHQPVAGDLRFIAACLKINNDLERVGDLAANIAECAVELAELEAIAHPADLIEIAERAMALLRDGLDAFVSGDAAAARAVCRQDDAIDALYAKLTRALRQEMHADASRIDRCLLLAAVARDLERIADHGTNIAEDVVYMVEGAIIRHPRSLRPA